MIGTIGVRDTEKLDFHLREVLKGTRKFENAAQGVSRMILERGVKRITRAGKTSYDFAFFREGKRHIVGWFDEINDFVNFVKESAEGGSSKEMAFVLVGEPGNGKTFTVEHVCSGFRSFLTRPENRKFTFEFINLDKLKIYGRIHIIQSQTFEDPVILAMNLFESRNEGMEYLARIGFHGKQLELSYNNYRPLGACSEYILNDIRLFCDGDMEKMLEFVKVVPVPIAESLGTVTGKYSARDKITSSAADLLGEEDLSRLLNLSDTSNPYKYNVRRGAIARVAGGGIHFSDEIFRNKPDLVQIYLQVIQNRNIELDGYKWPIDALIVGTSNNDVYNQFIADKQESPIKDRCRICYVSHNTDYRLQTELTMYAVGSERRLAITGEDMHQDPNLIRATDASVVLTRLPHSDKLTPIEMMKLEAGEVAREKNVKTLVEIKDAMNANPDVTKRWGQIGLTHRDLGRIIQILRSFPETNEGKCVFALDVFKAFEKVVFDYVQEAVHREKFLSDLQIARRYYREGIRTSIFDAYRDDPGAIRKEVLAYVNMIIGIDSEQIGPDKMWHYIDPQTGQQRPLKIDERYIDSVESRMGLSSKERREEHRGTIRRIYAQRIPTDPNYDFMTNETLVKAVTDVRLESDVAGAGSLVGALANRTNDENVRLYNRMIDTMLNKLGYCENCAKKTIEYFCEKVDES
ncbi:MAG: serine protein kinase [Candidatus Spechtbacteria bacterium RIFCSPHIGHO2_02_FULL_43_15b]|nr:MAG: serine protein kinase [Candidatus Spechtbacteria bacterium RIFCSPHIGHO2_02_FULL_43_15b]